MLKISWKDKVMQGCVLQGVKEDIIGCDDINTDGYGMCSGVNLSYEIFLKAERDVRRLWKKLTSAERFYVIGKVCRR